MILGIIYILFIIATMYLIVRDKRNSLRSKSGKESEQVALKDKKIALLIIVSTMLLYYVIGYFLKTDMLNAITPRRNGVTFSFIGVALLLITSLAISYIVEKFRKNKKDKN